MTNILFLGNVGSGKSASAVMEMYKSSNRLKTYSNIRTNKPFPDNTNIVMNSSMVVKDEITGYKKNGEPIIKKVFNKEYWMDIKEPINVVIDEAHITLFDSRRSMSIKNIIGGQFLSMIRRVVSEVSHGGGDLILISQLSRRVDIIAREMAHQVRYHIMHYKKFCKKCDCYWMENSEMPEKLHYCPRCGSERLERNNFICEIFHFKNIESFESWKMLRLNTFYKHYFVKNISKYFTMYDTSSWENLFDT